MYRLAYLYWNSQLHSEQPVCPWDLPPEQIYLDHASCAEDSDRPAFQQLLQACDRHPLAQLWLQDLRDLGESSGAIAQRLTQLAQRSVTLSLDTATTAETIETPLTLDPRQVQILLPLLLHTQIQSHGEQIRQGHARNRQQALPPPGKAPLGYRRGRDRYRIDRSTAPIVKGFFEHFLLYGSLRGAIRHIAQTYGKKVSVSTGQRWLRNPVYRGDLLYGSGDLVRDTHEALITRLEAAQVDRILKRNRALPPRTASAPRSLAGLVRCQTCQTQFSVARVASRSRAGQSRQKSTQKEYLYLRPQACSRSPRCSAVRYDAVLLETVRLICEQLPRATAALGSPEGDPRRRVLGEAIAKKEQALGQIPVLLEAEVLDEASAQLRQTQLRTEIARLYDQVDQLSPVNLQEIAQAVTIPQFWLDLSEAERRFFFREFIRQIELSYATSGAVEPPWSLRLQLIFSLQIG